MNNENNQNQMNQNTEDKAHLSAAEKYKLNHKDTGFSKVAAEQIYQAEDEKKKQTRTTIWLFIILVILSAVAYYRVKNYDFSAKNTDEELIYDVIEDSNNYYDETEKASFIFVIIRNYKDESVANYDLKYSFDILNKENSNGVFKIINMNTNEEKDYANTQHEEGIISANEKQDIRYKVYINSNTNETQTISYEIKYDVSKD